MAPPSKGKWFCFGFFLFFFWFSAFSLGFPLGFGMKENSVRRRKMPPWPLQVKESGFVLVFFCFFLVFRILAGFPTWIRHEGKFRSQEENATMAPPSKGKLFFGFPHSRWVSHLDSA